jgi:hypothetical protein
MRTFSLALIVLAAWATLSCSKDKKTDPQTTGTIQGVVQTAAGDTLVVGATIATLRATGSVTTDQQGQFTILHVPAGQYTVTATKTGYNAGHTDIAVIAGQTTTADIRLTRVNINTPPYEPVLLFPSAIRLLYVCLCVLRTGSEPGSSFLLTCFRLDILQFRHVGQAQW